MTKQGKSELSGLKKVGKQITNFMTGFMPSSDGSTSMKDVIKGAVSAVRGAIDPPIYAVITYNLNGTIKRDVLQVDRRSFTHKALHIKIDDTGLFYLIPAVHGILRYRVEDVKTIIFVKGNVKKPAKSKPGVFY